MGRFKSLFRRTAEICEAERPQVPNDNLNDVGLHPERYKGVVVVEGHLLIGSGEPLNLSQVVIPRHPDHLYLPAIAKEGYVMYSVNERDGFRLPSRLVQVRGTLEPPHAIGWGTILRIGSIREAMDLTKR